jgi:hypothetical protein
MIPTKFRHVIILFPQSFFHTGQVSLLITNQNQATTTNPIMRPDLVRKEIPDDGWRKGLFLSPPRKTPRRIQSAPSVRIGVRFAPESSLTQEFIDCSRPLCEEERVALWYSKEEYALMKRSSSFTVRLMMELQRDVRSFYGEEDQELCSRGLESKTRGGARRRRQNIMSAIDAVLLEQERQWEMGVFNDVYSLARVYREATAQCSMEAWLVAQKDAKAVDSSFQEHMFPSSKLGRLRVPLRRLACSREMEA